MCDCMIKETYRDLKFTFVNNTYLPSCVVCNQAHEEDKNFKEGEEIVLILFTNNRAVCYAHKNECFDKYKDAIESEEEIKKGEIIAWCKHCKFPVRQLHDFLVFRSRECRFGDY